MHRLSTAVVAPCHDQDVVGSSYQSTQSVGVGDFSYLVLALIQEVDQATLKTVVEKGSTVVRAM